MIKYVSERSSIPAITAIEVERETESSVWIHGRRNAKRSGYLNYFDTFEQAKDFLLSEAHKIIDAKKAALGNAEAYLESIEALTDDK